MNLESDKVKKQGYFLTFLSAFIYGFTPIIAKMTYDYGNNGLTMTFYRFLFVIPVLFIIIKVKGYALTITKTQFKHISLVGIIGNALAITLLYSSYSYIAVGSATVLHFMYPVFVCLINAIYYKEKISKKTLYCLVVAIIGIFFFIEKNNSLYGMMIALASGLFFSYYIVGMDQLGLKNMNPYVFNFYFSIVIAGILFLVGIISQQLILILPPIVYLLIFIVSILASIVGAICLQQGIKRIGGTQASIVSMFEPVTSLICGILFLNESLSLMSLIGSTFILGSIIYMMKE